MWEDSLNPTVYVEWKFNDSAPDAYEVKLLLGEQLAPRWQWGCNVFHEQETGGARGTEWGFSQAVGYSPLDSRFSVGLEAKFEHTTERGSRADADIEFLIGPSIQWRASPRIISTLRLFWHYEGFTALGSFLVFARVGRGAQSIDRFRIDTCSLEA